MPNASLVTFSHKDVIKCPGHFTFSQLSVLGVCSGGALDFGHVLVLTQTPVSHGVVSKLIYLYFEEGMVITRRRLSKMVGIIIWWKWMEEKRERRGEPCRDIDTWVVPGTEQGCTLGPHSPPTLIVEVTSFTSSSKTIHTSDSSTVLVKPLFAPEPSFRFSSNLWSSVLLSSA